MGQWRGQLLSGRLGRQCPDPALHEGPLVSVYFAPNVVSGFTVLDGQQAYDHIEPRRHKRLRPCDRDHDLLPHLEAMARHSTDLGIAKVIVSMPYEAFAYWLLFTSTRGTATSCGGQISGGWRAPGP